MVFSKRKYNIFDHLIYKNSLITHIQLFMNNFWWASVTHWIIVPQNTHGIIPRTCECHFIWQKELCRCDQVKDFKLGRLSYIIQVVPKYSNRQCPNMKEAEVVYRREGNVTMLLAWRWRKGPWAKEYKGCISRR